MAGFQILNENGQALKINEIDEIVCKFMKIESDKEMYCTLMIPYEEWINLNGYIETDENKQKYQFEYLSTKISKNWFDVIGSIIAKDLTEESASNWKSIAKELIDKYLKPSVWLEFSEENKEFNFPKFNESSPILYYYQYFMDTFIKNAIELIEHFIKLGYTPKKVNF